MLQEAGSPAGQVYFETNVTSNSFSIFVILNFVQPDVSFANPLKEVFLVWVLCPGFGSDIDATFNPG